MKEWFRDDEEREQHRQMMADPTLWPMPGNFLHLKHPKRMVNDEPNAFGRLTRTTGFMVICGFGDDLTTETYATVDDLLDAGWVVD